MLLEDLTTRWEASGSGIESPLWSERTVGDCELGRHRKACLGWSDSNCGIRWHRNPPMLPREVLAIWPETAHQRLLAFELLGGGYAAATGISAGLARAEGRTA
jgi:hypothetical protein